MQPTDHDRRLDEEVAQMTDALLQRQNMPSLSNDADARPFEPVVRELSALFEEKPAPAFRMRLERTLNETWAEAYPESVQVDKRAAPSRRFSWTFPLVATAAALAIVLAAALGGDEIAGNPLSGTASSGTGVLEIIVIAGIVFSAGAFFIWRSRR